MRKLLLRLFATALNLGDADLSHAQAALGSDIGVTLTATPNTTLVTGEPISIVLTVTNYGPQPVSQVGVVSSYFVNEFSQFVTNPSECFLFVTVADAIPTPFYYINWDVANVLGVPGSQPLQVGETRTCHFQFALTAEAPATVPFSFRLASYFTDINASNDSATVTLQKASAPPVVPVPALSPAMELVLVGLLAVSAAFLIFSPLESGGRSLRSKDQGMWR
jgi:hypothetical protein